MMQKIKRNRNEMMVKYPQEELVDKRLMDRRR
jgi:hypothetical protein